MAASKGAKAPAASKRKSEVNTKKAIKGDTGRKRKRPVVAAPEKPAEQPPGMKTIPSKKKVCIIGFADTRVQAPYDDDSYEMWGVNEMWKDPGVKRLDVLFELHDLPWIKEGKKHKDHYPWLCENRDIPIFMQKRFDEIPLSIPYPRDVIEKNFRHYFTNTISWELALAIHLGFEEIRIYGVNMATELEYHGQRPSVEYFVGIAEGRGIKVYLPTECDLLKCMYAYGFEDGELSLMASKLNAEQETQNAKAQQCQIQAQNLMTQAFQAQGAAGALDYIKTAFIYPNANFVAEKKGG